MTRREREIIARARDRHVRAYRATLDTGQRTCLECGTEYDNYTFGCRHCMDRYNGAWRRGMRIDPYFGFLISRTRGPLAKISRFYGVHPLPSEEDEAA